MPQGQRYVYYDYDLGIEAYRLEGILQDFPNHFHEYYVIGYIEKGNRHCGCKGREYDLSPGDLTLFNPHDNHFCAAVRDQIWDYRAVNIRPQVMKAAAQQITGKAYLPQFIENIVFQSDLAPLVGKLYDAIMVRASKWEKRETFLQLMGRVLRECAAPCEMEDMSQATGQIQKLCAYMEEHFDEKLTLDELLAMAGFGKSYLLRAFNKQIGISPYRYLQTVRLEQAKKFLEQGTAPVDVANMAGFNDQSHFTRFFKKFVGLTPKQYQRAFQGAGQSDTATEGRGEK